jgi:hypothetical protein
MLSCCCPEARNHLAFVQMCLMRSPDARKAPGSWRRERFLTGLFPSPSQRRPLRCCGNAAANPFPLPGGGGEPHCPLRGITRPGASGLSSIGHGLGHGLAAGAATGAGARRRGGRIGRRIGGRRRRRFKSRVATRRLSFEQASICEKLSEDVSSQRGIRSVFIWNSKYGGA